MSPSITSSSWWNSYLWNNVQTLNCSLGINLTTDARTPTGNDCSHTLYTVPQYTLYTSPGSSFKFCWLSSEAFSDNTIQSQIFSTIFSQHPADLRYLIAHDFFVRARLVLYSRITIFISCPALTHAGEILSSSGNYNNYHQLTER